MTSDKLTDPVEAKTPVGAMNIPEIKYCYCLKEMANAECWNNKDFTVPLSVQVQLLRVFALRKRLDLLYDSVCDIGPQK